MSCHMTLVVHPLAFKLLLTLPRIGILTMSPSGDINFLSFDGVMREKINIFYNICQLAIGPISTRDELILCKNKSKIFYLHFQDF